jgi:hypothetical protein
MRRTHARAGAIGVCDVPSIPHPCTPPGVNTFVEGAHMPGAQLPGRSCRLQLVNHRFTDCSVGGQITAPGY